MKTETLRLWYDQPANIWNWNTALPLGNGSLGCMFFGHPTHEQLQLNLDTLWAHTPGERNNPLAFKVLPRVRELLLAGRSGDAAALAADTMMATPNRIQPYQTMGNLYLRFPTRMPTREKPVKHFERWLDLSTATAGCEFTLDGVTHRHEVFVSQPAQAIVMRLSANRAKHINTALQLHRHIDATIKAQRQQLVMNGQCGAYGVKFQTLVQATLKGGQIIPAGDRLLIEQADEVMIIITAASDFAGQSPQAQVQSNLRRLKGRTYAQLLQQHLADYQPFHQRVSMTLASAPADRAALKLPTDQRLKRLREHEQADDPDLCALYFHFARYLLIACSRPGTLPANLQGIWNDSMTPAWNADYHTNINVQMNYWQAEVANLSELTQPLFAWLKSLVKPGRRTAKVHYGCRGWVLHHISDPWGFTAPGDGVSCGLWPMGGAWLCDHLWEHYLYTHDENFLRDTGYPLMKGACEFFLDYLVEDDQGRLLCGPSSSPENRFRMKNGSVGQLTMGCTMDNQILRELFSHTVAAATVLQTDARLRRQLEQAIAKLPGHQVGQHGQIQEWLEDYDEIELGHRHISHLFGLHPGTQISPRLTPELAQAAQVTLKRRLQHGGGHTGWSAAWIINMWARLLEPEKAHAMMLTLLRKATLSNMFDDHPPFQIDGNFGGGAGIAEMLLQSHETSPHHEGFTVALLPALPKAWSQGQCSGLRARGGFTLSMRWNKGKLQAATIKADRSDSLTLILPTNARLRRLMSADEPVTWVQNPDGSVSFAALAGKTYELIVS